MKLTATMTIDINVDVHELKEDMSSFWFWDEAVDDREMSDDEYMHAFTEYAMADTDDAFCCGYDATINYTPEQRAEILAIMKRGHKAWRATLAE